MTALADLNRMTAGVGRLALPRLSRPAAARCNHIARATGTVDAPFGTLALRISVRPPDAAVACDWCLEFQAGAETVLLHLPHALLSILLQAHEPGLVLQPPPSAGLLALLVDTLLHPVIRPWQRWAGAMVRFTDLRPRQAMPGGAVKLTFSAGNTSWDAALSGGPALDRLLSVWPAAPHALPTLPMPVRLWAGTTDLPAAVVASLRVGDGILLQTRPPGGVMLRLADSWAASVTQSGGQVLLAEPLRPMRLSDGETRMTPNSTQAGAMPAGTTQHGPGDLDSLDGVPIRLSFDVGQAEMPLAELRRLQAGAILPLGRGLSELVEISANGRRIGTGELVDVEGAPAVRITRLFGVG